MERIGKENFTEDVLMNRIYVGSPDMFYSLTVPGGEEIQIVSNPYVELKRFFGVKDYHLSPEELMGERYELVSTLEGPAIQLFAYNGSRGRDFRLCELDGKYWIYEAVNPDKGKPGLIFVRDWLHKCQYTGNDALAKGRDFFGKSLSPGGLAIGSPSCWMSLNDGILLYEIREFSAAEIESGKVPGYKCIQALEGPNIHIYGMNPAGDVQLLDVIEGDFRVYRRLEDEKEETNLLFLKDQSATKARHYFGNSKLVEDVSFAAAGYAFSLD